MGERFQIGKSKFNQIILNDKIYQYNDKIMQIYENIHILLNIPSYLFVL